VAPKAEFITDSEQLASLGKHHRQPVHDVLKAIDVGGWLVAGRNI
jgi:hypothetical protein